MIHLQGFLISALLLNTYQSIVFKLDEKTKSRCFVIRSEFSKSTVNFSYVVYSEVYRGNRIGFELKDKASEQIIESVKPDEQSYQRIFKFESDGATVYRACFYNPDEKIKSVKFFVEHKGKENYAEKGKLKATLRLIGELNEQAVKVEEDMFVLYMMMKNNEEAFNKSQRFLKFIAFIKFIALIAVACLQSVGVIKLIQKTNARLSDFI